MLVDDNIESEYDKKLVKFYDKMKTIYSSHSDLIEHVATGIKTFKYLYPTEYSEHKLFINNLLTEFYTSRIGERFLIDHFIRL